MTPHPAVRGLRRAELITDDPEDSVRFHHSLLDWTVLPADGLPADSGFDCWVGERRCATVREPASDERPGWQLVFAGSSQERELTGPDDTRAAMTTGRAQHGPWAPGPRFGELCWIELFTGDAERADAFWTDNLSWTAHASAADTLYAIGGRPVASRTSGPQPDGHWGWLCYFVVEDLEMTEARVAPNGGTVLGRGPHDRVGETLVVADPSGALCALAAKTATWGCESLSVDSLTVQQDT